MKAQEEGEEKEGAKRRKRKGEGRERERDRERFYELAALVTGSLVPGVSLLPQAFDRVDRSNPWSFPTLLNTLWPTMKGNIHLFSLHSSRKLFAGFSCFFTCLFQIIGHVHQNKLFSFHFPMMLHADARLLLWQSRSHSALGSEIRNSSTNWFDHMESKLLFSSFKGEKWVGPKQWSPNKSGT